MGTNYYRVNIPTEDDIKEMHRLIDERKFDSKRGWFVNGELVPDDAVTCVQDLIDNCTEEIHICKMSYGWKTCFDHNWGKYYQPNRKSLEEFLKAPNTVIKDEYGDIISYDDFWKMVDERDHGTRADGEEPWISKTYREWERTQGNGYAGWLCREDIQKCEEKFGVKCEDNDFDVDGLRFAVYSDFS